MFVDEDGEMLLSSECVLSSNAIEQSVSSKIIAINNNIDTRSHSETDKLKVNKEVNKSNNNTIDEMDFNNNMIEDKINGSLKNCIDVHSDTNVCNKNDVSLTATEVNEELKYNNIKSTCRQYHNCKEQFRISKAVSSKSSNPLSEICQKYYDKFNKEMARKKTKDLVYDLMKE